MVFDPLLTDPVPLWRLYDCTVCLSLSSLLPLISACLHSHSPHYAHLACSVTCVTPLCFGVIALLPLVGFAHSLCSLAWSLHFIFKVVCSYKTKESMDNREADGRCKGLNKVPARLLGGRTLGQPDGPRTAQSSHLQSACCGTPNEIQQEMTSRNLNKVPSPIVHVCSNLLLACFLPLYFLRAGHGLFECLGHCRFTRCDVCLLSCREGQLMHSINLHFSTLQIEMPTASRTKRHGWCANSAACSSSDFS